MPLLLLGGLGAGLLTSCTRKEEAPISEHAVYPNNHHIPGVGWFHARHRAFYQYPYNYYDPEIRSYFAGGRWLPEAEQNVVNVASPTPEAARRALVQWEESVSRNGFGSSGYHRHYGRHFS